MRRLLMLITLTLLLAALPVAAEWDITAGNARWHVTAGLDVIQQVRDAVLWERSRQALLGAITTAALPNFTVVNNGDGTGTVEINMPRPAADNWMTDYGDAGRCGDDPTPQELLDCVDDAIRADLKSLVRRYRHDLREQTNPVVEPDLGGGR